RLGALDWFGKRATGWLNARLNRGRHFQDSSTVATVLAKELSTRGYDHVVFSGDATPLGLRVEYDEVRRVLQPDDGWPPTIAVPGNHDYYTFAAVRTGEFERVFAKWQVGERIDHHTYPFVQEAGPLWLIGVNSAGANLAFWDSRGRVGSVQLKRLAELFRRLPPGPRVIVTHYPLFLESGAPERLWRRLRDAKRLLALAEAADVRLWLHGHRHVHYHRPVDESLPFPVVCAGSATQAERWSYNEYTFAGGAMHGRRRVWSPETGGFVDGADFAVPFAL
ncbi:MAG: metallophosphoesterase, partial [Zavarzinella sp.]|nr:metallophosphoesterase [Zavarzinella sp.]